MGRMSFSKWSASPALAVDGSARNRIGRQNRIGRPKSGGKRQEAGNRRQEVESKSQTIRFFAVF
jgi:hypothetical protein